MNSKIIGSGILIAGTCIGAVFIIIPISLLPLGSLGVLLMLTITAVMMYYSGALIFEVARYFPKGADLAEMASKLIGTWAGVLVQVLFSLLLYCLLSAYLTGGSAIIAKTSVMHNLGILLLAALGILILIIGIRAQDLINRLFVAILVISYLVFAGGAGFYVDINKMTAVPFSEGIKTIAILVSAFGYHVIIPSIRDYIGDDSKAQKQALFIGLFIPWLLYLIWCYTLYGLLPYDGDMGLLALSKTNDSYLQISEYLKKLQPGQLLPISLNSFMITSILSSYVGISLSLFQSISRHTNNFGINLSKILKSILVILPPCIFTLLKPDGFLLALQYAAVIIAIISLILPVIMVYIVRRNAKIAKKPIMLLVTFFYALLVIYSVLRPF